MRRGLLLLLLLLTLAGCAGGGGYYSSDDGGSGYVGYGPDGSYYGGCRGCNIIKNPQPVTCIQRGPVITCYP